MVGYQLADSIHACRFQSGTVLLDLEADRYFYVGGPGHEALQVALSERAANVLQALSIEKLVDRGFLAAAASRSARTVTVEIERNDGACLAGRVPARFVAPAQFALALWHIAVAMRDVRRRALRDIVTDLRDAKARIGIHGARRLDDVASISGIAGAARATDLLFGANRGCLPRSVGAMRAMMAHGFAPTMVIGVVDRPFKAHCWVEIDAFTVTDAPDHVATFRPILTI